MAHLQVINAVLLVFVWSLAAQGKPVSAQVSKANGSVTLAKLQQPFYRYPAAAVQGSVELKVLVNRDNSIDSVNVISGPSMLRPIAVQSAQSSHFECKDCDESSREYSMTYEFEVVSSSAEEYCRQTGNLPPIPAQLDTNLHKVRVFARQVWTCDPAVTIRKARSAKCLYLWKCAQRESLIDAEKQNPPQ